MNQARRLNVLLVEDDRDDAALVERALRKHGFELLMERVETADAMEAALDRHPWDVILSDFTMPRFSGLAAFELFRSKALDVPFIFVSGTVGEDVAVKAMRMGASDYLLKGNLARLAPAVEREVRERQVREARARAEQELRQSEERYDALFAAAPFPMWVFERESLRILAVNDAAVRHYGYSKEEFEALTIEALRPPEDVPLLHSHIAELKERDEGSSWRHQKRDGSIIYVEIKAHNLDYAGKNARLVAVNDVTERRRAEDALQAKEEQLRHSQKMEAVGRLAGGVAHDFNNLLSVILSYSELMSAALDERDSRLEDLREIRDAGRRAAELTKQLLLFSRQQVMERRVLDFNGLIGGMEKMLCRVLGEDVELECRPANGPAHVLANPGHLEQVLMNLAVNARDAMPAGGKLKIETDSVTLRDDSLVGARRVPPGRYVRLTVTDTGVGMDRTTQDRMFEPFFTTKERGKGTGLGLSTVFGIVQQSEGTIEVSSMVSQGTSFKVYIPQIDAGVEAPSRTGPGGSQRGTETVLLVEDDDRVRAVARNILRRNGYQVFEAATPDEALRFCDTHPKIDLLLSDVVMPKMGGPELSRLVVEQYPELRVVFMSGHTEENLRRYSVDATNSAVAFLQKPFTPDSLTRKVRETLDRGIPKDAVTLPPAPAPARAAGGERR